MLEIADLFCFDRTSTQHIFYSESFYHLTLILGSSKALAAKVFAISGEEESVALSSQEIRISD